MQTLNPEQAHAFLVTARGDRLEAQKLTLGNPVWIAKSELLGLKWEDVDLEDKRLSVRRILSAAKNGPTFTTPKNNKSRSVRLTLGAVEAMHAHRRRQ
jgi:integrase